MTRGRSVALMVLASAFLAGPGCGSEDERQTYSVWCRVHRRSDVSFEDWRYLRSRHMLPGQDTGAYEAAEDAQNAAAFATGMAAGTAASR